MKSIAIFAASAALAYALTVLLLHAVMIAFFRCKKFAGQRVNLCVDFSNIEYSLPPGRTVCLKSLKNYMLRVDKMERKCSPFPPGGALREPDGLFLAGSQRFASKKSLGKWEEAKNAGFTTKIFHIGHSGKEQSVDESIHYAIARGCRRSVRRMASWRALFTCRRYYARDVLLLATGDGNDNDGITSFIKECREALRDGIDIEIYAIAKSLSRNYIKLQKEFGKNRCKIYILDEVELQVQLQVQVKINKI
eukprot:g1364.t1